MHELPIGDGPFSFGYALDINDAGEIIAQSTVSNYLHTFLVTRQSILDLNVQTGLDIWPRGINNAGVVAGNVYPPFSSEAVTWSNGVVRYLAQSTFTNGSDAQSINKRGEVLATVTLDALLPSPTRVAALIHGDTISLLGPPADLLNNRGVVAGSSFESGIQRAFIYRSGTLIDLGTLPGDSKSWPSGMNNHGHVVGISEGASERYLAFLYVGGVMYELNDLIPRRSGWNLYNAADINDRGQIVGVGYYQGEERAFLLTPLNKLPRSR
jgi:probable HAF family extracellular repeat protein